LECAVCYSRSAGSSRPAGGVSHGGVLLGAREASANPPIVQVLYPNGGETLAGTEVELRWQGADPDGDEVFYTVEYSTDNGASWSALVMDWPQTNLVVSADELPGSPQARLRVLASDGFYCASDDSDGPFTVPDHAPDAFMVRPTSGAGFYGHAPVRFEAMAVDLEDGQLEGDQLEWRSDRDGLLGTGESLMPSAWELSEGPHLVTLTARDGTGHATVVTNVITVSRFLQPRLRMAGPPTNGSVRVEIIGTVPSQSVIEASSNLVDWAYWTTINQSNLTEAMLAPVPPGAASQFYRVHTEALPTIVASLPRDTAVLLGYPTSLRIQARGQWLNYQWFLNGQVVTNATNATLQLDSAQYSQAGSYTVVLSNLTGMLTSSIARLTIITNEYQVLHGFGPTNADGVNGWGQLAYGRDGALYGCARNGGNSNAGCIFRLDPATSGYTVLHLFTNAADGATPLGGAIQASDGRLYGTCSVGGTNGAGTAWRIGTNGNGFEVLHHFLSSGDCRNPQSELLEASDGRLYGTAYNGGGFGNGGVFGLNKDGSSYAIVRGFRTTGNDGKGPVGGLVEGTNGLLYGTTELGGSATNGIVFSLSKDGASYSIIKHLGLVPGGTRTPNGTLLIGSDGYLYGTTVNGGSTDLGTVFRLSLDGDEITILHDFGSTLGDPQNPTTALAEAPAGFLVGTSRIGGTFGQGALYRLNKSGSDYHVVRNFTAAGGDGGRSRSPVTIAVGLIFGTTFAGGTNDWGTVFHQWISDLNP
jgi:uncharacterized repeat protein (TIGR03803 family)